MSHSPPLTPLSFATSLHGSPIQSRVIFVLPDANGPAHEQQELNGNPRDIIDASSVSVSMVARATHYVSPAATFRVYNTGAHLTSDPAVTVG